MNTLAIYNNETRELTIFVRPDIVPEDEQDFSSGTDHSMPLKIVTGRIDDIPGYARTHVWSDIVLEIHEMPAGE